MNPTLNPFEKLLVGLVEHGIQFMTVGGMACVMNGHVRATEDVDILVKKDPDNIQKLLNFLAHYGEGFGQQLSTKDFTNEEGALRVIEDFPIDIFTIMGGNSFEDLLAYKKTISIQEHDIPFLNAKGLIKLKKNSVREKDKLDVLHLQMLDEKK